MSLAPGTVIDHYRIERPIGTGAFATIYLAHDDRLDTEVALKVLAENRALDVDARRRFVDEARSLRRVQSASVLDVYDIGETPSGQPYMALEYGNRGDLASRAEDLGRRATDLELVEMADFLSAALGSLHAVDLVHRDVKPHNILLRSVMGPPSGAGALVRGDERLILGDLGFVKDLDAASGLTVGGGSWTYQAPEQRNRVGTIDRSADLYAASAVLAWLALGVTPPDGASWSELISESDLAPGLAAALTVGLSPIPEDRPADVESWRDGVRAALDRARETDARSGRARGWALALVVGVVLATAGFSVGWLWSNGADEPRPTIDGDRATTDVTVGDHRVTITGPASIAVGTPATFEASIDPAAPAFWVGPDGVLTPAEVGIVFTATTEGHFAVSLLVIPPGREPEVFVHRARATQ